MSRIPDLRSTILSRVSALFMAAALPALAAERVVHTYTAAEGPALSEASGKAVFASSLYVSATGQPRLPLVMKSFLLPIDADVGSVSARLVDIHEEEVTGTYEVEPVPPMATGKGIVHWPRGRVFRDGKDVGVYRVDAYFPEERHVDARVSQQGEWKFVDCSFAPYRYNPVTGRLIRVVSLQIEVTYARASGMGSPSAPSSLARPQRGNALDRDFRKIGKRFVNEAEARGSYLSAGATEAGGARRGTESGTGISAFSAPAQPAGLSVTGRYIILTTSAMQSGLISEGQGGLGAFVAQKQAQGFTVQIVTESQWGGGTGDVAADRIRAWLKANYQALDIQYVLLIGDPHPVSGNVPMKAAYPWSTDMVPTDFFYSDLSGSWDTDHDGDFGEDEDRAIPGGPDAFAEVTVGRIPFYGNFADCDRILARTVDYQNTTALKAQERNLVLLPMVPLDPHTPSWQLGEQIREDFVVPNAWRQHRIYDTTLNDNGVMVPIPEVKTLLPPVERLGVSPRQVVTAWNTVAQGLTIWMTHGSGTGAAQILEYEHTGLLSDNAPGIVLHGSCSNSEPEISNNLSYMLLRSGAIASIAGTRVTWYTPGWNDFRDQNSDGGIAYHFAKQIIQNGLPVSDAFNAVRSTIVEPNWWNWIAFNTYGAPEITLATEYSGPKFDISRDIVDFGDVAVNDQTQIRTVTLENSGTTQMTVSSIVSDNARFTASGVTLPLNLAAGQKATLSIRFAPNALGWVKGEVTIRTSLGDKVVRLSAGATPAGEYLHLTDFPWGGDIYHGYYTWKRDTGPEGTPLSIGGKWYDRGLGGHSADGAEAYVTYNLQGMGRPIQSFYAELGIDDRMTTPNCGSAVYKVYLDNALAYTSPILTIDSPPLPISVAVGNAATLKLALTDAGDGGCGDHGNWGNTRLYVASSAIALPGLIQAENYKAGGQGVGYHDLTAGNSGGAGGRNDNVDIEATSDAGGGFNVGWIDAGEWLSYDVNVAATGTYTLTARMASQVAGTKTATVTVDGATVGVFNLTDASGWQSWRDVVVTGVNLSAGAHALRIHMTTGGFNLNHLDVAPQTDGNADLSALSLSAGALTPAFASGTLAYTLSVANSVASTTVRPTVSAATSTVRVNGVAVASGSNSAPIALSVGANAISIAVTAQNGVVKTYTATVTRAGSGNTIPLPGRMEAEAFKAGGQGVGYHDLTAGNAGGSYRPAENVDIEATTDAGGGYNVGWTDAGEWLAYDVNVASTGTYAITARIASGVGGVKTLAMTVDGVAAGTFTTSIASGWQSWTDVVLRGVSLTAGAHVIRLTMGTSGINLNYLDVQAEVVPQELLINGNFSNGLTGWQTYFGAAGLATITNEANSARITIQNQGSYVYDIQIYQPVGLAAGKTYTLAFDVKAEATPKNFRVLMEHNGSPWTVYQNVGYTVTAAAGTYQRFTLTWTQPVSDAGARVTFDFGLTNTSDAWVDNVSLK